MVYMSDLLNAVLGDTEDVYHKSWSGVATVYEDPKLKSFSCKAAVVIHYVAPLILTSFGYI